MSSESSERDFLKGETSESCVFEENGVLNSSHISPATESLPGATSKDIDEISVPDGATMPSASFPEDQITQKEAFRGKKTSNALKQVVKNQEQQTTDVQPDIANSSSQTESLSGLGDKEDTVCSRHKNTKLKTEFPASFESPSLCQNCSKSMLSYIMLVQQFLDNVAKDVSKQVDPLARCFECVKESLRLPQLTHPHTCAHTVSESKAHENALTEKRTKDRIDVNEETKSYQETQETGGDSRHYSDLVRPQRTETSQSAISSRQSDQKIEVTSKFSDSSSTDHSESDGQVSREVSLFNSQSIQKQSSIALSDIQERKNISDSDSMPSMKTREDDDECDTGDHSNDDVKKQVKTSGPVYSQSRLQHVAELRSTSDDQVLWNGRNNESQSSSDLKSQAYLSPTVSDPLQSSNAVSIYGVQTGVCSPMMTSPLFPQSGSGDGILTTLYRVERGLKDVSKGPTIWQRLAEMQNEQLIQSSDRVADEAFVTLARNNTEVLGCLVLGASLLLCGTSRKTCVLVADGVNTAFTAALSSVFHEVQHVRSLDSLGTTKLSLLDQPELGISFGKLNIWRLDHFKKCVYLNPDTVVVQNCDELFYHEELSAVPDIGWPDCFNSAVFVYKPSVQTFWQLLEFAEKQGSYDGGDQGLLNTYFNTWSQDIHKRLSFIYNLMANVSYTYTPAFKQFGSSVKVVQFVGPFKPWHVKFYSETGQIAPSSSVHPTYVQFVHIWLNVFRVTILPLFSQEIQKFTSSQNIISAYELLRFFPSATDSDVEFLLAPPSVRLRPIDAQQSAKPAAFQKLNLPLKIDVSDTNKTSPVVHPLTPEDIVVIPTLTHQSEGQLDTETTLSVSEVDDVFVSESNLESDITAEEGQEKSSVPETKPKSLIPGSEFGDYQGMSAWEQGRMDYEGAASSDTIIQRLHFLMGKPDRLV